MNGSIPSLPEVYVARLKYTYKSINKNAEFKRKDVHFK